VLNLEFNRIDLFHIKNVLVNLMNLEKICMFENPISNLFPSSFVFDILNIDSKCMIYIATRC